MQVSLSDFKTLKAILWVQNTNPKDWTEGLTCFKGNVEQKDQMQYSKETFLLRFIKILNLARRGKKKENRDNPESTTEENKSN